MNNTARNIQRLSPAAAAAAATPLRGSGLRSTRYATTTQYRLLSARAARPDASEPATSSPSPVLRRQPFLRSAVPSSAIRIDRVPQGRARPFHVSARSRQQQQHQQQQAEDKDAKTRSESEQARESSKESSGAQEEAKEERGEKEEKAGEEGAEENAESKQKSKKDDLPPPPPHGDKTPWQVFLETMQTELKQSKEWNESTKALASSAHEFVESESVKRARQAYEATSGAVSSTAANVVKTTAGAIGKGAAWTWETPVMKGVRKGANKTGEVLDRATKPIRETEAYRNVKNVIDDGSSSRYGGWVDKEERRRQRELREQMEKKDGVQNKVYQEDPK